MIGEDEAMGMARFLQSLRKSPITLFATIARPNDGGLLFVNIGLKIILMTQCSALKQDIVTYHDVFYQRLVRRSLSRLKGVFEVGFIASELIQAPDQCQ
jgi:hypothetical protein